MQATSRACDVCLAQADPHAPLHTGAGPSMTCEHGRRDYCSIDCLMAAIESIAEAKA